MKKWMKHFLALFLCASMIFSSAGLFSGLGVFAEEKNTVLFKTSFEDGEDLPSGETIEVSGVMKTDYGVKGKGLAVRLDTLTGSEDYLGSENKYNLFDGKTATKFLTNNSTCVISFALKTPAAVDGYEIASANDEPTRDPKNWNFYGSVNGVDWVLLDARTNVSFGGRFDTKLFTFENKTVYAWYKLDVTKNAGAGMTQFSSLDLYTGSVEQVSGDPIPSEVDESSIVATEGYQKHVPSLLFDNNVNTKYLVMDSDYASVCFKLKSSAVITRYAISSSDDHPERDPMDWTLSASTDGRTWTVIDERADHDFADRKSTSVFKLNNTVSYLWYKLEITAIHGDDTYFGKPVIQLSDLLLYTEENWREPVIIDDDDPSAPFTVVKTSAKGPSTVSGEGIVNLFDRDEATKAVFYGKTGWVSFKVNRAETITAYAITSANDWQARDPNEWTVYGSNDGATWTKIDERSGVSFSGRYEEKIFRLERPVSYLWYKLDITKIFGVNDYTQLSDFTLLTALEVPEPVPGFTAERDYGPTQTDTGKPGAWTGSQCLAVYGEQSEVTNTRARAVLFDVNIPVTDRTTLSYLIFPGLFNNKSYDYEYTSCRVMPDLLFTDGTRLTGLSARDQNGSLMTPAGQVEGETLVTMQWNYVECRLGDVAAGKTIDRIEVFFEMENAEDASKFITFFDDIKIEDKSVPVYEHLSDYITILRGTNNDSAFSRGLCTPGVTMPNGFNFYSPVTNPSKPTASYNYQQNGENNPLDSITVIHAPSYWLSSYGTWQFMANTSLDLSSTPDASKIGSEARRSKFSHENEIARAHYYSVTLDEGTPASGVRIEVTPTSHAAYIRFTFPENAENVNLIFDSLWGGGTLKFSEDGKSFSGTTSHNSAGSTKMYYCGEFDRSAVKTSVVSNKMGAVVFPKGTTVVNMKIATSFISLDQAKHSMELEIGSKDFDGVYREAQKAWDDLCGKFEIEGATYTQLVNFYSALYRMYAYPNLYSENEGTNEAPVWVYASPYRSGAKTKGILYTNNGFWDTYRTTWAGYSLFTAEKDGEMLDGLVQHYVDSGWIPRWICPGGVNCMVGTSSDIIFADAYIKGVDFNYEKAWESMIENASAYSADLSKGGRPNNNQTPFVGYVPNSIGEGYSSSIESYINDYGLYRMAEKMGLSAEAEYYRNRCLKYPMLFNEDAGFFMGRNLKGVFSATSSNYDPAAWGGPKGDYTESVGWVNTFPAVFDGEGMVSLYGSRAELSAMLNVMFDDSPESMRKVVTGIGHEICEFKEVRMGQYEHNNQPSHHVIYTYAFSDEPWRVQQYTREVLRHVYVGSEIGQGLPGDEDNGEMSAWYVFNALGFYPYCLASGEYVIGSPLFDQVTVHLDNGKDIVIKANNNSQQNVYIQSAKVNGKPYDKLYLTHETLTNGCVIEYEMGPEPSEYGNNDGARPTSLSGAGKTEAYAKDVTDDATKNTAAFEAFDYNSKVSAVYTTIASSDKLFDGNSSTYASVSDGDSVVFTGKKPTRVSLLTLACYDKSSAPTGVKIEVSNDGEHFITVYENNDVQFLFDRFVVPFEIPGQMCGKYYCYRVTFTGGAKLSEIELIGEEKNINISDVTDLLSYLSKSKEEQQQAGIGSIFKVNVEQKTTISDVTMLLNLLSTVT